MASYRQDGGNSFLTNPEYMPVVGSGDTSFGASSSNRTGFTDNLSIIPIACSTLTLYAYQGSGNSSSTTVTLYKSVAGSPTATALSVTVTQSSSAHATASVSLSAGDLISYQVSNSSLTSNGIILNLGLVCQ
jgi:hypothetical protein